MLKIAVGIFEVFKVMFLSPVPRTPIAPSRLVKSWAWLVAVGIATWIYAFKIKVFNGLETTSDLYAFVQWSTTWAGKGFYHDNFFGNVLSIHTYLICPLLGVLAYPFGAYGLFLILAIAGALGWLACFRLLRFFGVSDRWAMIFSVVVTWMPLAGHVFQDAIYGFHVELLEPTLALWLAYYLFKRSKWKVLGVSLALISIKEDAALLVMAVAAIVFCEDALRGVLVRVEAKNRTDGAWNNLAIIVFVGGALAIPLLLFFIKTQQIHGTAINLERLRPVSGEDIRNNSSLISYIGLHLSEWLSSGPVKLWWSLAIAGTVGMGLLRPHLLVFGLVTTLVAWLMQDQLLWAPRFVQSLAVFQLVACLGFISVYHVLSRLRTMSVFGLRVSFFLTAIVGILMTWMIGTQVKRVPKTEEFYSIHPKLKISAEERRLADRLFAQYREEGRRSEPVMASNNLFRYAHDRNLWWPQAIRGREKPVWILWDAKEMPLASLWVFLRTDLKADADDYRTVAHEGRFLLLKLKTNGDTSAGFDPGLPEILGGDSGAIHMTVSFSAGRAGHIEPLLSTGNEGRGSVFMVHYLSENKLRLGMENIGAAVFYSPEIPYEAGKEYHLEFTNGSLLSVAEGSGANQLTDVMQRRYYQTLLSIKMDGKEVLKEFIPPMHFTTSVYAAANFARSGSAGIAFTGNIKDVRRIGLPELPSNFNARVGAQWLRISLPRAAAGTPEPLVVVGSPGDAALAYVRVISEKSFKVGVEFWGIGAYESDELIVEKPDAVEVAFAFPALFPDVNDSGWENVPMDARKAATHQLKVVVNGVVVIERPASGKLEANHKISLGLNPIGGSFVGAAFTGEILSAWRLPLGEP